MKQNITLSLDKELLAKLRVIAAKRSMSVSRMLAHELAEIVDRSERYKRSKRYAMAAIDSGFHFGGQPAPRDQLHER
jgi:predicted transcriptional regulator